MADGCKVPVINMLLYKWVAEEHQAPLWSQYFRISWD